MKKEIVFVLLGLLYSSIFGPILNADAVEAESIEKITSKVENIKIDKASENDTFNIDSPTVKETLKKLADNYALVSDLTADMILVSTLNDKPFGEKVYGCFYFKAPNKEKTENFSDSSKTTKDDITIIDGHIMYLIDPINNIKDQIDLLEVSDSDTKQFNQMDLIYDQDLFLNKHTIIKDKPSFSEPNNTVATLSIIPNSPNNTYDKLVITIDCSKGIMVKDLLYRKNESGEFELIQERETIDPQKMPNGAWVSKKEIKKTYLKESGVLISTLVFENIKINTGLKDSDFDPNTLTHPFTPTLDKEGPDTKILYIKDGSLWTMNRDETEQKLLLEGPVEKAIWSPDGKNIAYLLSKADSERHESFELWVTDIEIMEKQKIDDSYFLTSFEWLPDGSGLVYIKKSPLPDPASLWICKIGPSEKSRPLYNLKDMDISSFKILKDNSGIVFRGFWRVLEYPSPRFTSVVGILSLNGPQKLILFGGPTNIVDIDSSPTGDKIVAADYIDWSIYVLNPDGTEMKKIASGSNPSWSPDGNKIAFSDGEIGQHMSAWIMDPSGENKTQITSEGDEGYEVLGWDYDKGILLSDGIQTISVANIDSKTAKTVCIVISKLSPSDKKDLKEKGWILGGLNIVERAYCGRQPVFDPNLKEKVFERYNNSAKKYFDDAKELVKKGDYLGAWDKLKFIRNFYSENEYAKAVGLELFQGVIPKLLKDEKISGEYQNLQKDIPEGNFSEEVLFKISELMHKDGEFLASAKCLEWMLDVYPEANRKADMQFELAKIYDFDIRDKVKSFLLYYEYLRDNPQGQYVKEVSANIMNLKLLDERAYQDFLNFLKPK